MLYFAYGSNISERQMRARCPGAEKVGPLTLPKGRLVFRGVADIIYDPASTIPGLVWRLKPGHERILDGFEGVASGTYKKKYIRLSIKGGKSEPCLYYKMANQEGVGPPIESYYQTILEGYRSAGLDEAILNAAVHAAYDDKNLTPDIRARRRKTTSPVQRRPRLAPHVTPALTDQPIQIKKRAKRK